MVFTQYRTSLYNFLSIIPEHPCDKNDIPKTLHYTKIVKNLQITSIIIELVDIHFNETYVASQRQYPSSLSTNDTVPAVAIVHWNKSLPKNAMWFSCAFPRLLFINAIPYRLTQSEVKQHTIENVGDHQSTASHWPKFAQKYIKFSVMIIYCF